MMNCLNCNRTDKQIPLITITFNGETKHICPQCLPILIHKSGQLSDKLPGMEVSPPNEH
jgi:hypothetical protein